MIDSLLVIPDAHAQTGVSNHRFDLLGAYIAHKQPDTIVCIGDFADMASLSFYDQGKRRAEGQRYDKDIKVAHDAMERILRPMNRLNMSLKKRKEKLYKPEMHMLYGNHCHRIVRAAENDPKLFGTLKLEDLEYEKFGWTTHTFLRPLILEGVGFNHYWPAGLKEMPIGGQNAAAQMTKIDGLSKVSGHSHLLQAHYEGKGRPRWGLVTGCFLDKEQITGDAMAYVSPYTREAWWAGCTLLHSVSNGTFEPVFVPMSYLEREFG